MGLEQGLPWRFILRWTCVQMEQDPAFRYVTLDEAMDQVYFTVRPKSGVERRYRLTIQRGQPQVEHVEGPPETAC